MYEMKMKRKNWNVSERTSYKDRVVGPKDLSGEDDSYITQSIKNGVVKGISFGSEVLNLTRKTYRKTHNNAIRRKVVSKQVENPNRNPPPPQKNTFQKNPSAIEIFLLFSPLPPIPIPIPIPVASLPIFSQISFKIFTISDNFC